MKLNKIITLAQKFQSANKSIPEIKAAVDEATIEAADLNDILIALKVDVMQLFEKYESEISSPNNQRTKKIHLTLHSVKDDIESISNYQNRILTRLQVLSGSLEQLDKNIKRKS